MQGTIESAGKAYQWWAGKADREGQYCVHCRKDDYGITRYLDHEPDAATARKIADRLVTAVDALEN